MTLASAFFQVLVLAFATGLGLTAGWFVARTLLRRLELIREKKRNEASQAASRAKEDGLRASVFGTPLNVGAFFSRRLFLKRNGYREPIRRPRSWRE